jgi:predicted dehydrogenase/nucleoside-diphosphate-sugar epimerase
LNTKQNGRERLVALVGTGYIAEFHARALKAIAGVNLVAVCDTDMASASAFAARWGIAAFPSLSELLARQRLDAVHVLTPPDSHFPLALEALNAGVHVFLEKPMCATSAEGRDLAALAREKELLVGVNHNMIFTGSCERLRQAVMRGELGEIDYFAFNYFTELGQIRAGPFNAWMLRDAKNPLLEIGAHPLSGLIDILGAPDHIDAVADREYILPTGVRVFRRWRIHGTVGRAAFDINIELGPGFDVKLQMVRGQSGAAVADLNSNVATIDTATSLGPDFDRYRRATSAARQITRQARSTLSDYVRSRAKVGERGNPYEASFLDCIRAYYDSLKGGGVLDKRLSIDTGVQVIETCERVYQAAGIAPTPQLQAAPPAARSMSPKILVLGGTGFIGSHLVQRLTEEGKSVRVGGRGRAGKLTGDAMSKVELVRADMRSTDDLDRLLDGIDEVYHLATSDAKTWPEYLEREVAPAAALGEACLKAGVRRLVYTGTIDSYYAGGRAGVISEATPLDPSRRRNYYARAKAEAERRLCELHESKGLPLVIFRPGIVIGSGGNPFHWGVGKWTSQFACQVWGDGHNKLPLVLVRDVADGLILGMRQQGIEGRSYNLIDEPLLSARDYLEALERIAGIKIDVQYTPSWKSFFQDLTKWPVKRVTGHPDGSRIPSYRDWESRTQKAVFDSSRARRELGWAPAGSKVRLIEEGIGASMAPWLAARD